jgi:DNA-binding transcriptional LysR family regulator
LNIRQLKFFLSAAETGSFYAAAEQLYVSRPAISKSISQLESEIGQPLFHRNADGVYLTDAAKLLYPRIQKVVKEFDILEGEMHDMKSNIQTVHVGFCNGTHLLFMDQIQEFSQKHPNIHLEIFQYQCEDALSELKNGHVDLVLSGSAFQDETLVRHPAYHCQALWGVQNDSPMGQRGYITDEEIHSHTICLPRGSQSLTFPNYQAKQESNRMLIPDELDQPDPDHQFSSFILGDDMFYLCKLVLKGKAILPISEKLIPARIEGISFVPCPEHPYSWQVDSYYSKGRHLKKGTRVLLKEVFTPPSEDMAEEAQEPFETEIKYAV